MKVTKLIREYVTEEVSKVYDAKVNPYSEQAEIDRETLKAFAEELHNQQREAIDKFISENELFDECWNGCIRTANIKTSIPGVTYYKTRAILDEKKWSNENQRAKNAKIRDIILSLELGANRQELNDMIAKLTEDV